MSIYIAGPMTWMPQFNYPAFDDLAATLRSYGYDVVVPSELDSEQDRAAALASPNGDPDTYTGPNTWGDFLSRDVKLIADTGVEAICVLPGWARSRGARLETFVAHLGGLPIVQHDGFGNLTYIPELQLYRAWTGEPGLRINAQFKAIEEDDMYEEKARLSRYEWLANR